MGLDLTALAMDESTCVIKVGQEEVKVAYKPSILTTNMLERLKNAEEANDFAVLADVMSEFIGTWDITAGGDPLPTDAETMKQVPLSVLQAIFFGIMEDAGRGEAESSSKGG